MEKTACRNILKQHFLATMFDELMPGILHNFANPLNGIIGRSALLQKRLQGHIEEMTSLYPHVALEFKDDYDKLIRDVTFINKDAETFSDLFWDVTNKFQGISEEGESEVSISQLLAAEMRFTNFFLNFKHDVRKELSFHEKDFVVKGSPADYSLCFFVLIYQAMKSLENAPTKEFFLSTERDHKYVIIRFRDTGEPVSSEKMRYINELTIEKGDNVPYEFRDGVYYAALLLQYYATRVSVLHGVNFNEVVVSIPH
jgi:signal transduction histidine kinase